MSVTGCRTARLPTPDGSAEVTVGLAWTPSCNRRRMRLNVSHEGLQEGEKPKVVVDSCRLRSRVQSEEEGSK
jgi:hypothetical protein